MNFEQNIDRLRPHFNIPPPRSVSKFIIYPSLWSVPNFSDVDHLLNRIVNNCLYFQTNYIILNTIIFTIFMILSMRTLLLGFICAGILILAVLFFLEYLPLARQIKQNHPNLVIAGGIALFIVTYHALSTILLIVGAALAPLPLWLLHATFRSSEGLIDNIQQEDREFFAHTPVGQVLQLLGFEPRATRHE